MFTPSYSIRFIARFDREVKGAGFPIYARIIVQRSKTELKTGLFVDSKKKWYKDAGIPKGLPKLEQQLFEFRTKVNNARWEMVKQDLEVTATTLKEFLINGNDNRIKFLSFFDSFISELPNKETRQGKSKAKKYRTTFNRLTEFLKHINKSDLLLRQFNFTVADQYYAFMKTLPSKTHDGLLKVVEVNKDQTRLSHIFIRALRKRYIEVNPLTGLQRTKGISIPREPLDLDELRKVMSVDLENESLELARDYFLWSLLTGMRFSDARKATLDIVSYSPDGKWLTFLVQKTNTLDHLIPLLERAEQIIEKYAEMRKITGTNRILPYHSNSGINRKLNLIGELAGIKKRLHHHLSRHTLTSAILLNAGVEDRVRKHWLSHSRGTVHDKYEVPQREVLVESARKADVWIKLHGI